MSDSELRQMAARIINAEVGQKRKRRPEDIKLHKAIAIVYEQAIKGGLEQWR